MQKFQKSIIESYRRIQAFLEAHPVEPPITYSEPKDALELVIARLADHASWQEFGSRVGKAEKRRQKQMMRQIRLHHLKPIAAIAKAELPVIPGITEALQLPEAGIGLEQFLAAAKAMRDATAQYQPVFLRNGRQPDFLEKLGAAISDLENSISGHAKIVGTRVGAGAGLAQELRRGRRAVEMLDTIVHSAFEGNDAVLASWRTARRVKQLPSDGGLRVESSGPVLVPPPAKAA